MSRFGNLNLFFSFCFLFPAGDALCDAQTEFTCDSGECVPLSKYNDHTQDCPDGSDEMDQTTECKEPRAL